MFKAPPYPLFLDLLQQPVLVVGGGSVGLRKARALIECAARVTVVSPVFLPAFETLADIERIAATYAQTHMARKMWRLVFAATDVPAVNAQVQKHAQAAGILCNRADDPDEGDFASGATVRLGATQKADGRGIQGAGNIGGVVLAISTSGASPVLAARIAREAAGGVDPLLPVLSDLLDGWRTRIKEQFPKWPPRRALLQRLAGDEMEQILRRQGVDAAQRTFEDWCRAAQSQAPLSSGDSSPARAS
jgi:siroheme synthase (precorrin-2 oxidase/ferrochelatase)